MVSSCVSVPMFAGAKCPRVLKFCRVRLLGFLVLSSLGAGFPSSPCLGWDWAPRSRTRRVENPRSCIDCSCSSVSKHSWTLVISRLYTERYPSIRPEREGERDREKRPVFQPPDILTPSSAILTEQHFIYLLKTIQNINFLPLNHQVSEKINVEEYRLSYIW